jgi:hypothetical protein
MNKRSCIAVGLLLAIPLGLLIWRPTRAREPAYAGWKLTRWLDNVVAEERTGTDEALRTIGSNAIPTLLKMIRAKDPPPLLFKLLQHAEWYRSKRINSSDPRIRVYVVGRAFGVLGTNAVSAVPDLIEIYEVDDSPLSQRCAAAALGHIGQGAQSALPALIRRLTHTNRDVRFRAAFAVMGIGGEPDVVVPALTSALKDPDEEVRWTALSALSRFEGRARLAVPEILKMLNDEAVIGNGRFKDHLASTLWRIAPEKVGKPSVGEDMTPMVGNEREVVK